MESVGQKKGAVRAKRDRDCISNGYGIRVVEGLLRLIPFLFEEVYDSIRLPSMGIGLGNRFGSCGSCHFGCWAGDICLHLMFAFFRSGYSCFIEGRGHGIII